MKTKGATTPKVNVWIYHSLLTIMYDIIIMMFCSCWGCWLRTSCWWCKWRHRPRMPQRTMLLQLLWLRHHHHHHHHQQHQHQQSYN